MKIIEKNIKLNHIIQRLKSTLQHIKKSQKIYDKDIAYALNLDAQYFAVIKKRGKIPYRELAQFCFDNEIDLKWMLFGETSRNIVFKDNLKA
jgi:hypothetical protein